ncbi:MAG: choice-of-anchor Q domain-containing protein [Chthoniobacterales bacterium]
MNTQRLLNGAALALTFILICTASAKRAIRTGANLVVTTTDDHDDDACTEDDCTLREAITAANSRENCSISFAAGVSGTVQLHAALPDIRRDLTLQGPGSDLLTVRRNDGGDYRIFTISNGTDTGPTVSIHGVTITNGRAPVSLVSPDNSGGGILNFFGSLTLQDCAVIANTAPDPLSVGGGICNHEGDLSIAESTVAGNTAQSGGGIGSSVTNGVSRALNVSKSTISGNTANGGNGGGIYSSSSNALTGADVLLVNSTVSGNIAEYGMWGASGGAIFNIANDGGTAVLELYDCTIAGNTGVNAGGIYNATGSDDATAVVYVQDTILQNGATGGNFSNIDGTIISFGYNLADDAGGGVSGNDPGGYLNGFGDMREIDAMLAPLKNNGGRTETRALLTGSPAINTGENNPSSGTDQRGYARTGRNDIGAFEYEAAALVSVGPRKAHGSAGIFDVKFPLDGARGFECRSGGASGTHAIVFTFANPLINVATASITAGQGDVMPSSGIGADPHEYVLNVTGIADGKTITVTLTDIADSAGVLSPSLSVSAGFLLADISGDHVVNAADATIARNRSGALADATNFRADINLDGVINAADATIVRNRSGTFLP